MDAALLLDSSELRSRTTDFYGRYLYRPESSESHMTLVLWDLELPSWFRSGLTAVTGTTVEFVEVDEHFRFLKAIAARRRAGRYLSVHDFVARWFPGADQRIATMLTEDGDLDYTSFEFPRFGLTHAQMEDQLARFVLGDLDHQREVTDRFFELLQAEYPYRIDILSGEDSQYRFTISGHEPWMELAGPLCAGNMRFAPGAELFSRGDGASGQLQCTGGLSILPLRSRSPDIPLCQDLQDVSRMIPSDPLLLRLDRGRVADVVSAGSLGKRVKRLLDSAPAFTTVVEIGLGLCPQARPLVRDWPAASNEAVPGIHIGVGADPSDTSRFQTTTHFDFVCDRVQINVNGQPFLRDGEFMLSHGSGPIHFE